MIHYEVGMAFTLVRLVGDMNKSIPWLVARPYSAMTMLDVPMHTKMAKHVVRANKGMQEKL